MNRGDSPVAPRGPRPRRLFLAGGAVLCLHLPIPAEEIELLLSAPAEAVSLRLQPGQSPHLALRGWLCGRDHTSEAVAVIYEMNQQVQQVRRLEEALVAAVGELQAARRRQNLAAALDQGDSRALPNVAFRLAFGDQAEGTEAEWLYRARARGEQARREADPQVFRTIRYQDERGQEGTRDLFAEKQLLSRLPVEHRAADGSAATYAVANCYKASDLEVILRSRQEAATGLLEALDAYLRTKATYLR